MKWIFTQVDKLLHLLFGILMMQLLTIVFLFIIPKFWAIILSLALSTGIMYLKELLWDKVLGRGVYNIKDFIAGVVGIIYGLITSIIFCII